MRVVMATDGSGDARGAVDWLIQAPLPPETSISVVSALPVPVVYEALAATWVDLRQQAEQVVEETRRRLEARWPQVSTRVAEGDARRVILEALAEDKAELAVLGARGLGAVASFVLGSVSLGVAREAPCPVLVCKGASRPVRSVTVALDGSEHAAAALRFVHRLRLRRETSLHLIAVVEPLRYPSTAPGVIAPHVLAALRAQEDECHRRLEDVLRQAAADVPGVANVTTTTLVGPPAPMILAHAAKHGCDLIVVGARGLGAINRVLLGSVSESVLRHAECPVLIVRGGA